MMTQDGEVIIMKPLQKTEIQKGHLTCRLVLLSVWGISLVLALPQVLATWCFYIYRLHNQQVDWSPDHLIIRSSDQLIILPQAFFYNFRLTVDNRPFCSAEVRRWVSDCICDHNSVFVFKTTP